MPEWLRIGEDKKPKFFLKQTDLKKKRYLGINDSFDI